MKKVIVTEMEIEVERRVASQAAANSVCRHLGSDDDRRDGDDDRHRDDSDGDHRDDDDYDGHP